MDEDSFIASLNSTWLLYDGGMRKGLREQSMAGIEAANKRSTAPTWRSWTAFDVITTGRCSHGNCARSATTHSPAWKPRST